MAVSYFQVGSRAIQGTISTRYGSAQEVRGQLVTELEGAAKDLSLAQHEHEGLPPITVQVVAGGPIIPYTPDEQ